MRRSSRLCPPIKPDRGNMLIIGQDRGRRIRAEAADIVRRGRTYFPDVYLLLRVQQLFGVEARAAAADRADAAGVSKSVHPGRPPAATRRDWDSLPRYANHG